MNKNLRYVEDINNAANILGAMFGLERFHSCSDSEIVDIQGQLNRLGY